MPETASPILEVTISEMEPPHLYRTFLSLLILRASAENDIDPYETADVVIHVWYSYKWPPHVVDFIQINIEPEFQPLVYDITGSVSHARSDVDFVWSFPPNILALKVAFSWKYWEIIKIYMMESFRQESLHRDTYMRRENDVVAYGQPLDKAFARMSPSRVAGLVKWRQTGLMLPYGNSTLPHDYCSP
jgi:hypothetical protein